MQYRIAGSVQRNEDRSEWLSIIGSKDLRSRVDDHYYSIEQRGMTAKDRAIGTAQDRAHKQRWNMRHAIYDSSLKKKSKIRDRGFATGL